MIKLSLQSTIYDTIISGMQSDNPWGAPKGPFYLLQNVITPFTPKPSILSIETDRVGEALDVYVIQSNATTDVVIDPRRNSFQTSIVADSTKVTANVTLGRGLNQVYVESRTNPEDNALLLVRATSIVSLWEAFARVLFSVSNNIIEEQKRAIYSKLATRLIEPFIGFIDLLPDIQSLQIVATRFLARGLLHAVGTQEGATNMIKALTMGTPVYRRMDKDSFDLYPALDPWNKAASQFGGMEAHVWIPNVAIANWSAFLSFINNQPDLYTINSVSEQEVSFYYQGELQRHRFDFDAYGTDYLTALARTECFKSISINILIKSIQLIKVCSASYTFDLVVSPESAIGTGRYSFDSSIPFDTGIPLDSDPIDPFTDGWVGLSLTGRFDHDPPLCLDTMVMPSTVYAGPDCCYSSYYTQILNNHAHNIPDITIDPQASGYYQVSIILTLQDSNGVRWDIRVNNAGELTSTAGSLRSPDSWRVTKPDATEACFSITTGGQVQVVSPPVGATFLNDTIYIKSPDSSIWWVRVNDYDEVYTTKIL